MRWGADTLAAPLPVKRKAIVWNDRAVPQHVYSYERTVHKSEAWPLIHFLLLLRRQAARGVWWGGTIVHSEESKSKSIKPNGIDQSAIESFVAPVFSASS